MCGSFFSDRLIRETQLWRKAKKTAFFCQNCGYESAKWMGQCPACREWNTFVEEPMAAKTPAGNQGHRQPQRSGQKAGASDGNFNRERGADPDGNRRTRPGARRRNCAGLPDPGRRRSGNRKIHTPSAGVPHAVCGRTPGFIYFRGGVPAPDQTARRADRRI